MTQTAPAQKTPEKPDRTPRTAMELGLRESLRWAWRQLTSMRTALILLLLLALAAVPGSLIPQENIDSLKTSNWQDAHKTLTPIYQKLGLFDVYGTPWFAAVYILLMLSLVGCIIPRLFVYWRNVRAQPPAAPRNLTRLPDSTSYVVDEEPEKVLARARALLRKQRYRLRSGDGDAVSAPDATDYAVAAEKGYLREVGNLVFHLSIIVVLVGFALGSLFGYKGGVIVVVGKDFGFSNELTQYDDFDPGSLFTASQLDDFRFSIDRFDVQWLDSGPRQGMAKGFQSHLTYQAGNGPEKTYDLRVNHPLSIGGTEVFLIGHGYAPIITVRDGKGHVAYSGPTIFLPENSSFVSFGVVKAPYAEPESLGLSGMFYPFEVTVDGDPVNLKGDIGDGKNAVLSLQAWKGDLNLDSGPQSVYQLDTSKATRVTAPGGKAFNLHVGQTAKLPGGLGSVTFNGIDRWNKVQISKQPGKRIALGGVCIALAGLLGSLFIRPRRVWVRARRTPDGTLVEVAALDRSGGGDTAAVVEGLVASLRGRTPEDRT
ncbi:cytochrome c biogenesis protein ResB [Nocardioides sp. KR10-350]|uniref:cytochrome c biogenesis protein ResB n=1 Tax=Nocardioides cheoyonin TaxID=3156615 RepID=UPI0032B5E928